MKKARSYGSPTACSLAYRASTAPAIATMTTADSATIGRRAELHAADMPVIVVEARRHRTAPAVRLNPTRTAPRSLARHDNCYPHTCVDRREAVAALVSGLRGRDRHRLRPRHPGHRGHR